MNEAVLKTWTMDGFKTRAVNASDSSFPARIPTRTAPPTEPAPDATTQQAFDLCSGVPGGAGQNLVCVMPYGLGANNDAFKMRGYGWRKFPGKAAGKRDLWVPVLLLEVTCTLSSTFPGVATTEMLATEFFCDTMTVTFGNSNVSLEASSPGTTAADSGVAFLTADLKGFQRFELTFADSVNTPTKNALVALL